MRQEVMPALEKEGIDSDLHSDCDSGDSATVFALIPEGTNLSGLYAESEGWSKVTVQSFSDAVSKRTEKGLIVVGTSPGQGGLELEAYLIEE